MNPLSVCVMERLTKEQIYERLLLLSNKVKLLGSLDSNILEIILNFLIVEASRKWYYGYRVNYFINCIYEDLQGNILHLTGVCRDFQSIKKLYENYSQYNIVECGRVSKFVRKSPRLQLNKTNRNYLDKNSFIFFVFYLVHYYFDFLKVFYIHLMYD